MAAAVLLGNSLLVGIEAEFTLNNLNAVPLPNVSLFFFNVVSWVSRIWLNDDWLPNNPIMVDDSQCKLVNDNDS